MSINEIQDIVLKGGGALIALMTIIQITPIKVNPWSGISKAFGKLVGKFGRIINADVLSEIEEIKHQQKETQSKLDEHIRFDSERDADTHRQRILRFDTDLVDGRNFTHEYFADMLLDIDYYEKYCAGHPDYRNNRAVLAIANIKRVFQLHEENNDFLK